MNIRFDKKLLVAIGISLLVAGGLTALFAIASCLSWGIVFSLKTILCVPYIKIAVDIYEEEDCLDLQDFWNVLIEEDDDDNCIKPCD